MQGLGRHELDWASFLGMGDGTTEGESSEWEHCRGRRAEWTRLLGLT